MRQTRHILEKYHFLDDLHQDDYFINIEEAVLTHFVFYSRYYFKIPKILSSSLAEMVYC